MKFIGITGGVGAGKSTILAYLRENYRVRTLIADEIAHDIMEPGFDCYVRLQKEFAQEKIWLHNGRINRRRLAEIISVLREYRLEPKRMKLVHPFVDREANMVLIEALSGGRSRITVEKPLIVYKAQGVYTDEIYDIYGY